MMPTKEKAAHGNKTEAAFKDTTRSQILPPHRARCNVYGCGVPLYPGGRSAPLCAQCYGSGMAALHAALPAAAMREAMLRARVAA